MGAIGSVLGTIVWSALPDAWHKSVVSAAASAAHGVPGFSITPASLPGYVLGIVSLVLIFVLVLRYRTYERTHHLNASLSTSPPPTYPSSGLEFERDELKKQVAALEQELEVAKLAALRMPVAAAKATPEPKLIVSIKRVAVDTRGGGFTVLVVAIVSSEVSAVTAHNWDVSVTAFKKRYVGEPIHVAAGDSLREGRIQHGDFDILKPFERHAATTSLPAITLTPVVPGALLQGFYLVSFQNLGAPSATLLQTLLLSYTDHNRLRVDVPITSETEVEFGATIATGPPW